MSGPVALVTGSSRGIGRAIALRLAAAGHRVVVNYRRDADAAAATVAACRAAGGEAVAAQADAADGPSLSRLVSHAQQTFGPIDCCVANAGLVRDRLVWDCEPEDFDAVVRGNLRAAWLAFRAVWPAMCERRRGTLLAVSSASALVANPGQSAYAAAKAGCNALVRELARQGGPYGIRANAVVAGLIATDATAGMTRRQTERALERVALDRIGTVDEVAAAAAFLCDEERASYVTGCCLAVDGGLGLGKAGV